MDPKILTIHLLISMFQVIIVEKVIAKLTLMWMNRYFKIEIQKLLSLSIV